MSSRHELRTDFDTAVLERSHQVPVLVDFWAEWCGPCRMLGPVLEDLAEKAEGRWELVKVDTEAHTDVAQRYGIRSIPAVKLFSNGEVIGEFVGALPEPQIQTWLRQHLPGPGTAALSQAQTSLIEGDRERARREFEKVLELDPDQDTARLELARLLIEDDPAAAREHLESITGDAEAYEKAQHLLHLIDLVDAARAQERAPDDDVAAVYRQAALDFAHGDLEEALSKWIGVVEQDRGLDDDGARRACIALFALLGEDHPLAQKYRRRFSMALSV
jgi:putative thioredoxin